MKQRLFIEILILYENWEMQYALYHMMIIIFNSLFEPQKYSYQQNLSSCNIERCEPQTYIEISSRNKQQIKKIGNLIDLIQIRKSELSNHLNFCLTNIAPIKYCSLLIKFQSVFHLNSKFYQKYFIYLKYQFLTSQLAQMCQRVINWSYFENKELINFMRNNRYPFQINHGIIRFEMDLFKYISLDDLLVDYGKSQYIQFKQKILDQISASLRQLIQHLNDNNLQYFLLQKDKIYIEINDGLFKQIVLTHLTTTRQLYNLDILQLIPTKPWYLIAWTYFKNVEISKEFINLYKEISIQIQKQSQLYSCQILITLREYLQGFVFRQLIDSIFDQDKIKMLYEIYYTIFQRENITDEILEDFMNQSYYLEKFNDPYYIFRLIFLNEIYQYSKIYKKKYQRVESQQQKEQRKKVQQTNQIKLQFIQELLNQVNAVIRIDKENLTKDLLNSDWDITDNNQKLALLNEIQQQIGEQIKKELAQID
ncbi:hypothetical protein pb186bvf_020689 [Paramecium bursaria]